MTHQLSKSEITAETIYNLLRNGRMGHVSFIHNFKCLALRSDNIGAFYLVWLLSKSNDPWIIKLLTKSIDQLLY